MSLPVGDELATVQSGTLVPRGDIRTCHRGRNP